MSDNDSFFKDSWKNVYPHTKIPTTFDRMIDFQMCQQHYRDKLNMAEYFNIVQEMFDTLSDARTELKYRTDGAGTVKHTIARIDAVQARYIKATTKANPHA